MGLFRLLAVPLLISVCAAAQTPQTKRLPQECLYTLDAPHPPLKNPFTRPIPFRQPPFPPDGVDLTRIIPPQQFQVHDLLTVNEFNPGAATDHYYADVRARCRALSSSNAGKNMY
jgi:hypothetical protein